MKQNKINQSKVLYTLFPRNNENSVVLTRENVKLLLDAFDENKENSSIECFCYMDDCYGGNDTPSVQGLIFTLHYKRDMTEEEIKARDLKAKEQKEARAKAKLKKAKEQEKTAKAKIDKIKKDNPDLKDISDDVIKKILEIK